MLMLHQLTHHDRDQTNTIVPISINVVSTNSVGEMLVRSAKLLQGWKKIFQDRFTKRIWKNLNIFSTPINTVKCIKSQILGIWYYKHSYTFRHIHNQHKEKNSPKIKASKSRIPKFWCLRRQISNSNFSTSNLRYIPKEMVMKEDKCLGGLMVLVLF